MSRHSFFADRDDHGQRLDRVVHRHLGAHLHAPLSRAQAQRLVESRRVRIDGRSVTQCSSKVCESARIEVEVPAAVLAQIAERAAPLEFRAEWVVYEDDALLVVDKPAGVLSDATRDPRRDHLVAAAERWLGQGRRVRVRAVHRLDAGTSGILVLAKTRAAAAALAQAFRERRVHKRYLAVVAPPAPGELPARWTVSGYLAHRRGRTRAVRSGGERAETEFAVEARGADWALLQARPVTGRTHQIRVHAADSSAPILGDPLYAPAPIRRRAPRLMLHAHRLDIVDPTRGAPRTFEAPLPADMAAVVRGARPRAGRPGVDSA